jgi:signal transduction histidine kinase
VEDVKVSIFQAVRELLFNIVKHANVRQASVDLLISEDETLVVTVRDEGVGFDPEAQSERDPGSGFGLFSLRERLEMVGGSLELTSRINGGVTAIIKAPLNRTPTA